MRGNLPGPEGVARRGASAALHGLPVVPPRAAPRALHPLPLLANAAHAKYSDRLPGKLIIIPVGDGLRAPYAPLRRPNARGRSVPRPATAPGSCGRGTD